MEPTEKKSFKVLSIKVSEKDLQTIKTMAKDGDFYNVSEMIRDLARRYRENHL